MAVKVSYQEFKKMVSEVIDSLPIEFLNKLDNVEFVIEEKPPLEIKEKFESNGRKLIGLYQGIPYKKRTRSYNFVLPDKITIYKSNIEDVSKTVEDLKENIRHTIIHELAHYFGISDAYLKKQNLY